METETDKAPHPMIWVAAILLIVVCGAGVAALMGWIPSSVGGPELQTCASVPTQTGDCAKIAPGARLPLPLTGASSTGPGTALPFRAFFFEKGRLA